MFSLKILNQCSIKVAYGINDFKSIILYPASILVNILASLGKVLRFTCLYNSNYHLPTLWQSNCRFLVIWRSLIFDRRVGKSTRLIGGTSEC